MIVYSMRNQYRVMSMLKLRMGLFKMCCRGTMVRFLRMGRLDVGKRIAWWVNWIVRNCKELYPGHSGIY